MLPDDHLTSVVEEPGRVISIGCECIQASRHAHLYHHAEDALGFCWRWGNAKLPQRVPSLQVLA